MKKIFLTFLAVATSVAMFAGGLYKNSVGVNAGSLMGFSYKGFIFGFDDIALQVDAGFKWCVPGSASFIEMENGTKITGTYSNVAYYDLEINPNILFQKRFMANDVISLSYFFGGGFSIGAMRLWDTRLQNITQADAFENKPFAGKFGFNAMVGLELGLNNAPIAIDLNFRPGYGMGWQTGNAYSTTAHFFDWTLALGVRYCF